MVCYKSQVLSSEAFSVMISALWLMTTVVGPILARTYRPSKSLGYKRRTINSVERDSSEFRILACIHNQGNISSLVNILEASNATRESPVNAFAVNLVENTGRAAAMLIVHDTCKGTEEDEDDMNQNIPPSNRLTNSFENLEIRNGSITVQQLTIVSSYSTIHEDICSIAEDKRVSLIVAPFHKKSTLVVEGVTSSESNAHSPLKDVNKNVLDNAKCSVAIFVDRGFTALQHMDSTQGGVRRHFYMLFIGGPDDRDALAYAWRMSQSPRTRLTVIRFVPSDDVIDQPITMDHGDNDDEEDILNVDDEKPLDDEHIKQFTSKSRNCENVEFVERVVSNGDELMNEISALEQKSDLFVVGRGKNRSSPLTVGFLELSEYPELGPLGDILVSSSFMADSSVLIVQQGTASSSTEDDDDDQYNGGQLKEHTAGRMTWQVTEVDTPEFAPFVHHRGRNGTLA